jgi:hypothetical protein
VFTNQPLFRTLLCQLRVSALEIEDVTQGPLCETTANSTRGRRRQIKDIAFCYCGRFCVS